MPQAIAVGISVGDFWDLTPQEFRACVEGKRRAVELEHKLFNQKAWLQGMYIQASVAAALSSKAKYPKEPIGPTHEPTPEELRAKIRRQVEARRRQHLEITDGEPFEVRG